MKLSYFQGDPPNFGDEINASMWNHLLPPGFLDEDEGELFLGIGSILWDYWPKAPLKVVAGSGWGGYTQAPDVHNGTWEMLWVRGPRTAAALRLPASLAITDAAVLLRGTPLPPPRAGIGAAFMPHVDSVDRGDWAAVCRLAGVAFLDPRAPVEELLARIRGATVVVTEAMHGAIVADALRTPWVAVRPSHPAHRDKWLDWAESLGLELRPATLPPSSLLEGYTQATGLRGQGRTSRLALSGAHARPVDAALQYRAARALRRMAESVEPQLSRDAAIEEATARSEEALHAFVARWPSRRPQRRAS